MRIVIAGGGISGLTAAWFLARRYRQAKIVLLEQDARLGGCIETREASGFLFEMGPRTFEISRSTELFQMIRELGLERDVVVSDSSAANRFILHQGKLRSVRSLWRPLLRAILHDLAAPKGTLSEESIFQFASRRFGKGAAELFFDPIAKGVFAGDIRALSLDACFPALREAEQTHRSVAWAMAMQPRRRGALFTLSGGMSRLIDALSHLPIEIYTGHAVQAISSDGMLVNNRLWDGDLLVCALPGPVAAKLCGINLSLANALFSVVALGYQGNVLSKKGYGYLVPSIEQEALLGQIWDSSLFPLPGQTRLTSMVRGEPCQIIATDAMARHLGVKPPPDALSTKQVSIPQYELGHREKVAAFRAEMQKRIPRLKLVGNYFDGASVENCIRGTKILTAN